MKKKSYGCINWHFIFCIFVWFMSHASAQIIFNKHTIDNNFGGANSVYAIDVNGDSLIDVLGAGLSANSISLWLNDGDNPINWSEQIITNNFTSASSVYAADFDGDGDIDVLGSSWSRNEIAWWRNNGGNPIQWSKQIIGSNFNGAEDSYAADVDHDGDIDVLGAAMTANQIAWWRNNGGNPILWTKEVIHASFSWARSVYSCDANGDSLMDILGAAYNSNDITVWYQNSDSTWTEQIIDGNFLGAHKVHAADVDNDGDTDVLGAAHVADDVAWWRNDGGSPIQWTKFYIDENLDGAISVYATDINRDGNVDVLAGAEVGHDVVLYQNNGGNPISWAKQTIDGNFTGAWTVYAEDLNNDSAIDVLAAASYANDITWWENAGITGINKFQALPDTPELLQNYPNPFNSTTTIKYYLSHTEKVVLKIFNTKGQEVKTLINKKLASGNYEISWNGYDNFGHAVPSGLYFYRLSVDSWQSQSKKLLIIK